jgi:hypothetical protein
MLQGQLAVQGSVIAQQFEEERRKSDLVQHEIDTHKRANTNTGGLISYYNTLFIYFVNDC